ncbi:hypothetical protein KO489_04730 [Reinekea forsetii]|nr:hypothetical protein [Reinekea forsetii]
MAKLSGAGMREQRPLKPSTPSRRPLALKAPSRSTQKTTTGTESTKPQYSKDDHSHRKLQASVTKKATATLNAKFMAIAAGET